MERKVRLKYALEHPDEFGDLTRKFVRFKADPCVLKFSPEETSYEEVQMLENSNKLDIFGHPFLHDGEIYVVMNMENYRMYVGYLIGSAGEKELLEKCGKLVCNKELGIQGKALTIDVRKSMPKDAYGLIRGCLIANPRNTAFASILYVTYDDKVDASFYSGMRSLCPIALLPSDICILIEDDEIERTKKTVYDLAN